jgi:hypothetical protein
VAFYVIAGAWLILGGVIALVVYFTGENQSALEAFWEPYKELVNALGCLMAFIPAAAAVLTFLGVTQETASRYPRTKKRGAWYALSSGVLCCAVLLFPLTYFATGRGLMEATATLIPSFIPGMALLIFLQLTEKDYLKPWARVRYERGIRVSREMWSDPVIAARLGMVSGAIWIFAAGLFILLGFLIGFQFSWLVFIFAVAVQLTAQSMMMKPKS